jgi:hypothetical protein
LKPQPVSKPAASKVTPKLRRDRLPDSAGEEGRTVDVNKPGFM